MSAKIAGVSPAAAEAYDSRQFRGCVAVSWGRDKVDLCCSLSVLDVGILRTRD